MRTFCQPIAVACAALVISACNPSTTTTAPQAAPQTEAQSSPAAISAGPNPVPAGSETTTIKWTTGDGTDGKVFVSAGGAQETEFASGPSGKSDSPIQAGVTYEFRLYNADHTKQLAKITVTRPAQ